MMGLNTDVRAIGSGAVVGAAAGHFIVKDWKKGAMIGALVTLLTPMASGLVSKVIPSSTPANP